MSGIAAGTGRQAGGCHPAGARGNDDIMIPFWLHTLSAVSLLLARACAAIVAIDVLRHPQHMWIMNLVWPIAALFGSVFVIIAYFKYGRLTTHHRMASPAPKKSKPFAVSVGEGATHCGAGCTLGDICAEILAYVFPAAAIWFGWQTLFNEKMFAVWVLDFVFAFAFGIVFQYFAIAPMRGLSFWPGLKAALKADTLSLTAWQVGMYGFMAIAQFYLFRHLLGAKLEPASAEFWFMMQIAMIAGFFTSYPVNWWLIRAGIKEAM
jgi:hypothetical protein